jgi:Leucine-rich repeat (LRR) protein
MRYNNLLLALREPNKCFELDLANQSVEALPDEMADFRNLESLDLRGNPTLNQAQVFSKLAKVPNLQKLTLMNCEITHLDAGIAQLRRLKYLFLDNNQLTHLPEELGHLTELANLSADANQLETLPESFWNLTELKFLSLNHNQFTHLGTGIGNLRKLVTFHLKENPLTPEAKTDLKARVAKSVFILSL